MRETRIAGEARPCCRFRFSRRLGRMLPLRPAVDCTGRCRACPWNPAEQARRLSRGVWRRGGDGLLRLCFPQTPEGKEGEPCPT